jgi:hypothetical protein
MRNGCVILASRPDSLRLGLTHSRPAAFTWTARASLNTVLLVLRVEAAEAIPSLVRLISR